MRPFLLSIAVAVSLAVVGPSRAGAGMYEAGRGDDREDYLERLKDQREDYLERLEEQQEDRERYEKRARKEAERALKAERKYREDLREAEREYRKDLPARGYRGGYDSYRHSGYRGYTPLGPYPTRIVPQPGVYHGSPAQPTYPYGNSPGAAPVDQPFAGVGDWLGFGEDGYRYGGDPSPGLGVPYGAGPDALQDSFAPSTGGQITALADQLVGQADIFLQAFFPKIGIVPQGEKFLADGAALRDAAIRFREVAYAGATPADLAAEFRNVVASWQQLEARMARVSKGRIGPNIAKSLEMKGTIEQINQLMPY